eukprot:335433_1
MERKKTYEKKEILFDEKERSDYLSGFHKRKLERRKYGLALQKLKDRKARIEGRKEAQEKAKKELQELSNVEEGEGPIEEELSGCCGKEVYTFMDDCTRASFGGEVTVEVNMGAIEGDKEEEEEARDEELQRVRKERAMKAREKEEEQWSLRELVKKVGASMPPKKRGKRKKGKRNTQDNKKSLKKSKKK